VSAGIELAAAVRRGEIRPPKRIYVALGFGGTAAGIAMGCAIGSLDTEIVAVRASKPSTASLATLASIVAETTRFARALDPTFPPLTGSSIKLRVDGRFVGRGYGAASREGNDAVALANRAAAC
jgi:1-aminocyclopropane-1-carboxylate deaminase/D-cysteine desulfhydrase-like pyridoxal-dependent ACC family enzyme